MRPYQIALFAVATAGCSPAGQVRLGLGPDEELSTAQELASLVRRIEVVIDSPQGLAAVAGGGERAGGGEARDWDGDGALELVFSYQHEPGAPLPRLEFGIDENAGRLLEFRVLGRASDGSLIAYGGSSWTPVEHEIKELAVPFNLRPRARPPQVLLTLPAAGQSEVPSNLSAVTLVFSTTVDETTVAAVRFSGPLGDEPFDTKWEVATLNEGGLLEEQRSVLNLVPRGLLVAGPYEVGVGSNLKSAAGLGFDQQPRLPGAQPFTSGFEARLDGVGVPVICTYCDPGYACDAAGRCAVEPTCEQACEEGQVCDGAAVQCVEDCSRLGLCPVPSQRCDSASGLCC